MDAMQILWKMSMMLKTLKNDAETKRVASVKKKDESQVEFKENSVDVFQRRLLTNGLQD